MKWFKIIKMPRDPEEPDQSWYHEDWGQLPRGLKEAIYDVGMPLPRSAYTGAELKRIELDGNDWKPRLPQRPIGLIGAYGIWDTDENRMQLFDGQTDTWVVMSHTSQAAAQGTQHAVAAAGSVYTDLQPEQIGIAVTWYNRPHQEGHAKAEDLKIKVIMGKDSKWLQERPGEAEFFTNQEAAILGIYAYYPKKKKAMMKDFNLGTVESTSNPILQNLVDRGYFRVAGREDFKEGEVVRAVPIINEKGKAAAPYMPEGNFNTMFRREVINNPEEPFFSTNLGHWAGSKGIDFGVDEEGNEEEGAKFHIDPHPKEHDLR